jgi:HTH-type transcriptional regulator/antitoxin HigA
MRWKPIKTESEYNDAIDRVSEILDQHTTECLSNELLLLSYLINEYEDEKYPIE